jgi:hypothetical protein
MPVDNHVLVKTTETAYNPSVKRINKQTVRLGDVGATAKTVIRNYAKGLGITDPAQIKSLQDLGKSEVATLNRIEIVDVSDAKTQKAIGVLMGTGYYLKSHEKDEKSGAEKIVLSLKTDPETQDAVKNARWKVFKLYSEVAAQIGILKNNEEINTLVLTGPLTNGLDEAIRKDSAFYNKIAQNDLKCFNRDRHGDIVPTYFNKKMSQSVDGKPEVRDLKDLVLAKMDRYVGEHITPKHLADSNEFEIICDNRIKVPDNTVAGKVLLDNHSGRISQERGNWWRIPRNILGLG